LPNIIKIDPHNFELCRFKVGAFFETQYSSLVSCLSILFCVVMVSCVNVSQVDWSLVEKVWCLAPVKRLARKIVFEEIYK